MLIRVKKVVFAHLVIFIVKKMNKNMNTKRKYPNRLTNETARQRVETICKENGYTFISFCDNNGQECEYFNNQTHLKLFCPKCNKVWCSATYNRFTQGTKCPNCKKVKAEDAINKIKHICNTFNYAFLYFCNREGEQIEWNGVLKTYLCLRCNNCGNEWHSCSYDNFIRGRKCPMCRSYFKEERFNSLNKKCEKYGWEILGFYNDNDEVVKKEESVKVRLKCKKCGYIWDKKINAIYGKSKCPNCANKLNGKMHISKEADCLSKILNVCDKRNYEFLGFCDKDGNDSEWYGSSTYLKLKCLVCGNIWNTCTYYNFTHHLRGCPRCKQSHMENEIRDLLIENEINFKEQKKFDWLGGKSLDFYIPSKNVAIECQGRQHFEPVKCFGGLEEFKNVIKRDDEKRTLCEENGIKLLYFSNLNIEYPYEVIEDKSILLKKITE